MEPSSCLPLAVLIDLTVSPEAAVIPTIASAMKMWAFLTCLANPIADAIPLVHQVSCSDQHRSGMLEACLPVQPFIGNLLVFAVSGKELPPHSSPPCPFTQETLAQLCSWLQREPIAFPILSCLFVAIQYHLHSPWLLYSSPDHPLLLSLPSLSIHHLSCCP